MAAAETAGAPSGWRFVSHGLTHVGLVRRRNEDAFLDSPEVAPGFGLWAVADGMGGHDAGDYASNAIIAALRGLGPMPDLATALEHAEATLGDVDVALRDRATRLRLGAVIASTVVVLFAQGGEFACLWAGDSRLYCWRAGALRQLSVDHSRVQELIEAGLLRPEAAAHHPDAHVVTQAIGGGRLAFGLLRDTLMPGDRFLLCSDGLTNMLPDAAIGRELGAGTPQQAADRLLGLTLAQGAIDNVTIVVVHAERA